MSATVAGSSFFLFFIFLLLFFSFTTGLRQPAMWTGQKPERRKYFIDLICGEAQQAVYGWVGGVQNVLSVVR